MSDLPGEIFRRWTHSFEEDEGDVKVYRSENYDFPRARGRSGVEFRPDGTLIDWAIGPADAAVPTEARWEPASPNRVVVRSETDPRPSRLFEIVEITPDRLKLREVAT